MRNISVFNNVTLDGVMQAPAGKNEDTRGGFERGGWAIPSDDAVKGQVAGEGMAKGGDLLFGRRTWQHMFKAWHGRTDNPFTEVLDRSRKYVASRTLKEPLDDGTFATFRLARSVPTTTGVVIATYERLA